MFFFAMLNFVMGIVFLIYFRTAAKKNPYLLWFVLGKFLQGAGILLVALKFEVTFLASPWFASILITLGMSVEVFIFTSYDLIFHKRNFQLLLLFCLAGIIGVLFSINTSDAQIVFFFNLALGGVYLNGAWLLQKKKSASRFARVARSSFVIYGLIWIYAAIHALINGPDLDMFGTRNHARMLINLGTLFNFVIVSLGYTMLQKEMDEERIKESAMIIKADNEKLKELNQTKDQFFSIIAHDLRGPIGGLAQLGELLSVEVGTLKREEQDQLIQLVAETSKKSFILLENLLLWSQSESGELEVNKESIDVKELFTSNLALMAAGIKQKHIQVSLDVEPELQIHADKQMLSTVFRNLLSNAIKFTQPGGHISLSAEYRQADNEVCLHFKDDGIGIPDDKIELLLSLDSKFSTAGTLKEKGSGLGLKLCKQFVQRHQGSIQIQSTMNKGSEFSVYLPAS